MTLILAIDVETSGLPPRGIEVGHEQYPWPVQIGAVLFGMDGHDRGVFSTRVRAEGRSISKGAAEVHGISSREAGRSGIPEISAINIICHFAAEASYLTGYNVRFDRDVIWSALIRQNKPASRLTRPGLELVDLMLPSQAVCKLSGEREDGQYKWPRLSDALTILRNERPSKRAHDAFDDAKAAKRLFLTLVNRKLVEIAA